MDRRSPAAPCRALMLGVLELERLVRCEMGFKGERCIESGAGIDRIIDDVVLDGLTSLQLIVPMRLYKN